MPPRALGEIAEFKLADGDPQQAQHRMTDHFEHPAQMPVAALHQSELEPGISFALAQQARTLHAQHLAITRDHAFVQARECDGRWDPFDLHVIGARDLMQGGEYRCRPFRIVGEQQQPFAGLIETAHRRDPRQRTVGEAAIHGVAPAFVLCGGDQAAGFVDHHVD